MPASLCKNVSLLGVAKVGSHLSPKGAGFHRYPMNSYNTMGYFPAGYLSHTPLVSRGSYLEQAAQNHELFTTTAFLKYLTPDTPHFPTLPIPYSRFSILNS